MVQDHSIDERFFNFINMLDDYPETVEISYYSGTDCLYINFDKKPMHFITYHPFGNGLYVGVDRNDGGWIRCFMIEGFLTGSLGADWRSRIDAIWNEKYKDATQAELGE